MKDNIKKIKVALAGNPNVGKTCVFNALTGSNQHVGNWPGVTVEKKEGFFNDGRTEVELVDLPGIYSFSPNSLDEKISRDFLLQDDVEGVVLVVDASNLERNLYLLTQALELRKKTILVLNMMDVVRKENMKINIKELSDILGVPVIEAVASNGEGINHLRDAIIQFSEYDKPDFKINYGERIDCAIDELALYLNENKVMSNYDPRWLSIKLLEDDIEIFREFEKNGSSKEISEIVDEKRKIIERYAADDIDTFFIEKKYGYVSGLVKEVVSKKVDLKLRMDITEKIDKVLTNRVLGIPLFVLLMYFTFQFVFKLGDPLVGYVESFVSFVSDISRIILVKLGAPHLVVSAVSDGVVEGVGGVLVFLPIIALLYIAIGILEDSGYMARAAFVMDKIMHTLGLHGKSFIPMVVGFGCTVPAVMATRTLESKKDRILTILILPFMSCGARLPIYALFTAAFFRENGGNIVFGMYLIGIFVAVVMARILKSFLFKSEVSPLIMELPPYRIPLLKNLAWKVYYRCSMFVKKAGTLILVGVLIIWFLGTFPQNAGVEDTYLARLGKVVAPIFKPAGFGSWQASVALTTGIVAKEIVVGTFGTIYGLEDDEADSSSVASKLREDDIFNSVSAFGFMVFSLLYVPCFAAVGAIKKEIGKGWAFFTVAYTFAIAWLSSVLIFQIGSLIVG